jgi:hypothetical protein
VRYEHEVEVHAATLEAGQVSDHHLCPRCLREDGEPTASPGLVLIRQSRKTLYLDGGRLLVAPTDWRILCRPISSTQAVRQLSAGKSGLAQRSSPGSTRGEEGGKLQATSEEQRLRGENAQVVRRSALGRRPTRGGESARTRWSCRGNARPPNLQARRSHGRAHWHKETALCACWGAHRARVEADA